MQIVSKLDKGQDTGYKLIYAPDTWASVGPGGRVKLSNRSYVAQTPDGRSIRDEWTVVRQSIDKITIKPIIKHGNKVFLMFLYAPYPAAGEWLIEFPNDILRANETAKQTARRILEEKTGCTSNAIRILSEEILVAPFRFEQHETIAEAINVKINPKKLRSIDTISEVLLIPEKILGELLESNIIKDFKTRSIIAEHLLNRFRHHV